MPYGWGEVDCLQVVGHEIVGMAASVRKGSKWIKVYLSFHSCSVVAVLILPLPSGQRLGRDRCLEQLWPFL